MQKQFADTKRHAMTMLEIILALGVLAAALVVTANISRISSMNAVAARDMTQAQLLGESVMSQLLTGMIEFESVFDEPVLDFVDTGATNPNDSNDYKWVYSVEINSIDDYGLCEVIITVTKYNPNATNKPVSCRLVRWMLDKVTAKEMLESEESESEMTSDASTGSTSQSSGGAQTGGGQTGGGQTGGGRP